MADPLGFLRPALRVLVAQGAMGWAYRGDLDQLHVVLATLTPDHLRELSTAAAMLSSAADDVLTEKTHG